MNSALTVYVTQDSDGEVVGVVSNKDFIQTGRAKGLRTTPFELDSMKQVRPNDRPWVVYFQDANVDKPQVWPIAEGFPEEEGPTVLSKGIQFVVYAENAVEAINKVYGELHFDSWDIAVSEWGQRKS